MIKTYTLRPETVRAVQWTGNNTEEVKNFIGDLAIEVLEEKQWGEKALSVETYIGCNYLIPLNSFITINVNGKIDFYSSRYFFEIYEEREETQSCSPEN